ncbi:MAG: hypothetical protein RL529_1168 [Actinomycetota bacterium]
MPLGLHNHHILPLQKAESWTGLKLDKPIHDLNERFVDELPLPIL